jgi:predicted ribosome-associated RNA-binding protein Tma20
VEKKCKKKKNNFSSVEINKDHGVKNEHYLNDGLWTLQVWDDSK